MKSIFRPKLIDTLRGYSGPQFARDLMAGLIVGIVALPLAIAFGIASGVTPEQGLYTAIIGGFLISALGGSRVQIGGPTGAFIVVVYGVVQEFGIAGLVIATFLAGLILIGMGLARLGVLIRYIPHPLIVGFTSGIAVIIFSSQLNDFLGIGNTEPAPDFLEKWRQVFTSLPSVNIYSVLLATITVLWIVIWPRVSRRVPGSLLAILFCTAGAYLLHWPVETIGSRFGTISATLPAPAIPSVTWDTIREMVQPAFVIAMLGAMESLLSAVVADGMIGGNHRSNTELIGQGIANIGSSLFGGIPATGAMARTATNVRNGGRTPVAGIVHALVLLLILLFAGKWAIYIPVPVLAGVLVVVAYHMSEWKSFVAILRGPRSDAAVLLTSFLLTVLVNLTVAIEIGMVLAAFLFMQQMIRFSDVRILTRPDESMEEEDRLVTAALPEGVEVFEVKGPLFFGAAYKFREAMRLLEKTPQVLIIRMPAVPIVDATGIQVLKDVFNDTSKHGTRLILSEVKSRQVQQQLEEAGLQAMIGQANITESLEVALMRSRLMLAGDSLT